MGHSDKSFAATYYTGLAAEAQALAKPGDPFQRMFERTFLNASIDPVAERWERQTAKPVTLHVQHKGAEWVLRMECDSYDGDRGPKATDWWLSAVRFDGVWFDPAETFTKSFIDELEHAARVMPE